MRLNEEVVEAGTVVPVWFRKLRSRLGGGSSLAPGAEWCLPVAFFFLYLAYGYFHRTYLADWVGFAVDEGFTTYGAQRVREGQLPHRDFFFFWTPGILALHALVQELGLSAAGERMLSLLASAGTGALILRWSLDLQLGRLERGVLLLLLMGWSFPLWNVPYSSWFAVFFALAAVAAGRGGAWVWAGALFALSFWFKQNIGILSASGLLAFLFVYRERKALSRFCPALLAGIGAPFLALLLFAGWEGLRPAVAQIFLFPLRYPGLMSEPLPLELIGAPMAVFGLWLIGLYFFQLRPGLRALSQAAVVLYGLMGIWRTGMDFFLGAFFLLSLLAWPAALAAAAQKTADQRRAILIFWLPLLGAFLQVFPRWDFQHFLFVFPLSALFLLWAFAQLRLRYPRLPRLWIQLPALLLVLGGGAQQAKLSFSHFYGRPDPAGFVSFGSSHRLNQEMEEVRSFLHSLGLRPGDPLLVMPNATVFYRFSGFRNPTPHDQFFPGYVSAFGAEEGEVLARFEAAGGSFVVVQQRSKLDSFAPALERRLREDFEPLKEFPVHFSVWKKRETR
jgi:hypothetical protein